jgi:hypothetical protein
MNVVTAKSAVQRKTIMTTFTIDKENNITAFGSAEEAAAAIATPFDSFASQQELAKLVAGWPAERLVAIWNGLPGVEPLKKFKNAKIAASRIWERIQSLGEAAKPAAEPAKPTADKNAKPGAPAAKGAPTKSKASTKTTAAKKAPKGKKAAKAQETAAPREGSKTAQAPERAC